MAQGKEWDKTVVVEALRPYFLLGYSVNKACELAQIPHSTVATWIGDDEELRLKIGAWQGEVSSKARQNIIVRIFGQKEEKNVEGKIIKPEIIPDLELSQWWLERKDKDEFTTSGDASEMSINLIASLLLKGYAERHQEPNK